MFVDGLAERLFSVRVLPGTEGQKCGATCPFPTPGCKERTRKAFIQWSHTSQTPCLRPHTAIVVVRLREYRFEGR